MNSKLDAFIFIFIFLQMIFDITGKKLISYDPENSTENVCEHFAAFVRGLISFPINLPGTAYYKCLEVFISLIFMH